MPAPLPFGLMLLGSVLIVGHLAALMIHALASPSGPWPSPFGPPMRGDPPAFAGIPGNYVSPYYLRPLKMTHNYHFLNNSGFPGVSFEVRLKDDKGAVIETITIPEKDANPWVRYRQELLARGLANDQVVEPRQGETIPAPHQKVKTVGIWDATGENKLIIRSVPEHLVPRERTVMRPSEWSLVLAHAFVRHLCREHGAVSGELIRLTREPVAPMLVTMDEIPPGALAELQSNFGELPR
jgi:hypothetical protein